MPKVPRPRGTIRRERARQPVLDGRLRPPAGERPEKLDRIEKISAVCESLCSGGYPMKQARDVILERYGEAGRMTREYAYRLLAEAAANGWLRFRPPPHLQMTQEIADRYEALRDVRVIHSASPYHVASRAAGVVLDLLAAHTGDTVHLGIAGGFMMREVMESLAELLVDLPAGESLPRKLVFHSLGAGFDEADPTMDPASFYTALTAHYDLPVETGFVDLKTPRLVRSTEVDGLRQMPSVRHAFREAKKVDIVLTSGSDWNDEHSSLRRLLANDVASRRVLEREGCIGNVLWRPIGPHGPIEVETRSRAFTLFELSDLADLVERGKHVVMALGPCARCLAPKSRLLRTVLDAERPLVSHLVTDSPTARRLLRRL